MSEEIQNTEQNNLDPAMESFYNSLPKEELSGGSPEETNPENKEEAPAEAEQKNEEQANQENNDNPDGKESTFDLSKYFEESSEGLFKSEEDYKSALSKIKDYDALSQKVQVLESEKESIFANDYIKKLNNLHKEGYSPEQIKSFNNLIELGDIKTLDPKEALIQNEILNNGRTRVLAEKIVSNRYGLNDLSLDDDTLTPEEIEERKDQLEIVNARMEDDAKPVIQGFEKELEGLNNIESPEQKALDEAAKRKAYENALEPFVSKLQESFPKKIVLPTGEEGVEFAYDLPEDFLESVKSEAKEYFNHPDMEVNQETVNEFVTMKKALFVYQNFKDYSEKLWNQAKNAGIKEATAKFENPHGLDNNNVDVNVTNENIEDALMSIARK